MDFRASGLSVRPTTRPFSDDYRLGVFPLAFPDPLFGCTPLEHGRPSGSDFRSETRTRPFANLCITRILRLYWRHVTTRHRGYFYTVYGKILRFFLFSHPLVFLSLSLNHYGYLYRSSSKTSSRVPTAREAEFSALEFSVTREMSEITRSIGAIRDRRSPRGIFRRVSSSSRG